MLHSLAVLHFVPFIHLSCHEFTFFKHLSEVSLIHSLVLCVFSAKWLLQLHVGHLCWCQQCCRSNIKVYSMGYSWIIKAPVSVQHWSYWKRSCWRAKVFVPLSVSCFDLVLLQLLNNKRNNLFSKPGKRQNSLFQVPQWKSSVTAFVENYGSKWMKLPVWFLRSRHLNELSFSASWLHRGNLFSQRFFCEQKVLRCLCCMV